MIKPINSNTYSHVNDSHKSKDENIFLASNPKANNIVDFIRRKVSDFIDSFQERPILVINGANVPSPGLISYQSPEALITSTQQALIAAQLTNPNGLLGTGGILSLYPPNSHNGYIEFGGNIKITPGRLLERLCENRILAPGATLYLYVKGSLNKNSHDEIYLKNLDTNASIQSAVHKTGVTLVLLDPSTELAAKWSPSH